MDYLKLLKQIFVPVKLGRCLLAAVVPALLFYSFSLLGLTNAGFSIMEVLRDPAQQSGQSSFLGFLSNIGVWLWVSSAAICFFASWASEVATRDNRRELLFLAGTLSIMLAVDDFFMIHDRYIGQKICYLTYAICALSLLFRHYRKIIEIEGFAFLFAGFLLALSILTDLIQGRIPMPYSYVQIFEEGFKFVGASIWLYFCCRIASSKR